MNRFTEPITDFYQLDAWNGGEIYRGEEYLIMENGDLVLDEYETIIEWVRDHSEKRIAGEETN
ncbi:MAG: hypothetical protein EOM48_13395 [Bacilli bacterium]|nr:hypothetical protein [Bacilli bacterium]